jgi:hypothetical protein
MEGNLHDSVRVSIFVTCANRVELLFHRRRSVANVCRRSPAIRDSLR